MAVLEVRRLGATSPMSCIRRAGESWTGNSHPGIASPVPASGGRAADQGRARRPSCHRLREERPDKARNLPLIDGSESRDSPTLGEPSPIATDMNRRYAYRDYEILVSAQPVDDRSGWRPEICVIAPDDHWQFIPTHHSLVANDAAYCLEIGRRCAESAIQSMDVDRELADYEGPWH
jgi:hypothetical protein